MTPMPPPLVIISVFSPLGRGLLEKKLHQSKASLRLSALRTPHCLITWSKTSSDPASDPVCDAAAMAPFTDLPDLMTMTGFFAVAVLNCPASFSPSLTAFYVHQDLFSVRS